MDIIAGDCTIVLDGESNKSAHAAGGSFQVPGKSGFTITVESGLVEYICSFL
jgi:uncharacterized protein YaiE (UPF0345 family)